MTALMRQRSLLLYFILPALLSHSLLIGQQYPITHYTRDRGLLGNEVWDIHQDQKGYMWFATSTSLVRYNGKDYKYYTKANGLSDEVISSMSENKNGDLWFGTSRGVSRLRNDQFTNWVLKNTEDRFGTFADSYNRVWAFSTAFPGDVFYFQNDSMFNFSELYGFKNQAVINISEDNNGALYFLLRDGRLYKLFATSITEIPVKGIVGSGVRYSFFDSNNNFIICAAKGLAFIPANQFHKNKEVEWLLHTTINYGAESRKGYYWFASEAGGLHKIQYLTDRKVKPRITTFTTQNGLLSNNIYILDEDAEGNLWIGYDSKGISKISSLKIAKYGYNEGFHSDVIYSLTKVQEKILVTTERGNYDFSNARFSEINIPKHVSDLRIYKSLSEEDGSVLLGAAPGLYKMDNSGGIHYIGLKKHVIRAIMKDHTDRIWIGTHSGIFTLQNNDHIIEKTIGIEDRSISKIIEFGNQHLFIGTDKGLLVLENGTTPSNKEMMIDYSKDVKALSSSVNDVIIDHNNMVIVATKDGIVGIDYDKDTTIEYFSKVNTVSLFLDSKRNLWAGTVSGLYLYEKSNGMYQQVTRYTQKDGLAANEFSENNTIYEDKEGKLYFGTFGGITIYDPSEESLLSAKPICNITEVHLNDKAISVNDAFNIEIPQSQSKISFHCEALSYYNEDAINYEYYLAPVEKEWSNSSTNAVLNYGYLEPEQYTFFVRAVNQFGIPSEPQSISFSILAPVWKRPWFVTLSVIVLVLAGYGFNHYRQAHVRARNILLEKMVLEKTGELKQSKEKIEEQYKHLLDAQKELVAKKELESAYSEIQRLQNRLAQENIYLKEKTGVVNEVSSIIGRSKSIQEVRNKIGEVAHGGSTILITGETGVGKNLVAEAIHGISNRKERALVTVNCAAIPDSLVESELFGHEKGAFTGATERRIGKFEVADGSTIFLDEIGDMNLPVQAKILNVLQSHQISRVGGNQTIDVDVRIIAATNHDLMDLVRQGKFRQDLFYRINVFGIHIPPLRDRKEDIEPLAKYFIDHYGKALNKPIKAVTKSALDILGGYPYPGNIRELENIVHRSVLICKSETITEDDIIVYTTHHRNDRNGNTPLNEQLRTLEEIEKQYILQVLESTQWKISGTNCAADILGLHPNTLRSRMEKLKIPFTKEKPVS